MQLTLEGGSAVAIFVRCFANRKGIEEELERRLHVKFPRGVLAAISVILWITLIFNTIIFHLWMNLHSTSQVIYAYFRFCCFWWRHIVQQHWDNFSSSIWFSSERYRLFCLSVCVASDSVLKMYVQSGVFLSILSLWSPDISDVNINLPRSALPAFPCLSVELLELGNQTTQVI